MAAAAAHRRSDATRRLDRPIDRSDLRCRCTASSRHHRRHRSAQFPPSNVCQFAISLPPLLLAASLCSASLTPIYLCIADDASLCAAVRCALCCAALWLLTASVSQCVAAAAKSTPRLLAVPLPCHRRAA
eukprot:EW706141.1.p1 GENE.EW706141.1~~EW706141.1.p1  ORF type:complete len:130 (+),score=22.76 EW706141.1:230-619(+)